MPDSNIQQLQQNKNTQTTHHAITSGEETDTTLRSLDKKELHEPETTFKTIFEKVRPLSG